MSCQGQLELLRLLFTEALYDEHLSRVSSTISSRVCPEGQGFPWNSAPSLLPQKLLWDLRLLQSGVLAHAGLGLAAFSSPLCSGSLQKAFDPSLPLLGPMAKA